MAAISRALRGSLLPALFFCAPSALADAVPPPPSQCPPGTVGVTSHAGPRCEPEAPQDCADGFRGVLGGKCVLDTCDADADCTGEKRCRPFSLCFEPHVRRTSCGAADQPRRAEFASPRPTFGGPCAVLENPVTDWIPSAICGQAAGCAAPAECRSGSLCVSSRATAPPDSAASPAGPVPSGVQPVREPEPVRPSGCGAGCANGRTGSARWASAAAALLALAFLFRRSER